MTTTDTPVQHFERANSRLGTLLAGYDASWNAKHQAELAFNRAQAEHDNLVAAIKAEAANRGLPQRVDIDAKCLRHKLRLATGSRTSITKLGKELLQTQHPKLWKMITRTDPVQTLIRLTGAAHDKAA